MLELDFEIKMFLKLTLIDFQIPILMVFHYFEVNKAFKLSFKLINDF